MIIILNQGNRIIIKGHALYDVPGRDIVCASVSSIVITTLNGLTSLDSKAVTWSQKNNYFQIDILNSNHVTRQLITNMLNLLGELESQYPQNIKIKGG